MRLKSQLPNRNRTRAAITLVEVLMALLILGIMITGVVSGFVQSQRAAEWSAYSLAAEWYAMQPVEQARAAKWDPYAAVPVDEVTNLAGRTTNILDIPITGVNIVYATNVVTVRTVSATPPLKEIYVECTWSFPNRGVFTNYLLTYRAPGQSGSEE